MATPAVVGIVPSRAAADVAAPLEEATCVYEA